MNRYAALLRGIAPSGVNMTNDKLRGVFEALGFETVGSVLASGNLVFRSADADVPSLEQQIEDALRASRGRVSGTDGAAQALGIAPSTLESRIQRLGIEPAPPVALPPHAQPI